jgi:ATP dependent DNA ligase domain/ATP dependent DNA ligase C terminal region
VALSALPARQAYLDGELCGVRPDGKTSFSLIQAASDSGNADALVFFLFDLLYLDGEVISAVTLHERKERLRQLLSNVGTPLQYSDHQIGRGAELYAKACELSLEGIISKRADAPYSPGDRGLWVKVKCENREELVVVGWTDPEGARPWLGALLLAYYDPDGRHVYAGRVGTGIDYAELGRLWRRLQPLATSEMPLDQGPTSDEPFWFTARPEPRALGSPGACGRSQIPDLDRPKTCFVRWFTRVCERTRIRPRSAAPCRTSRRRCGARQSFGAVQLASDVIPTGEARPDAGTARRGIDTCAATPSPGLRHIPDQRFRRSSRRGPPPRNRLRWPAIDFDPVDRLGQRT